MVLLLGAVTVDIVTTNAPKISELIRKSLLVAVVGRLIPLEGVIFVD